MDFSSLSPLVPLNLVRQLCDEVGRGLGDHFETLGLCFTEVERGKTCVTMPYAEHLVGNPETGVLHGGAITTLLDTTCGFAAATVLSDLGVAPTLDLRVDYLRRGEVGKMFYGEGRVYRVTPNIIFTEGVVFQTSNKPIARCSATFTSLEGEAFAAMSQQLKQYLQQIASSQANSPTSSSHVSSKGEHS